MNPGDSVQDVSRTGPDEASGIGAAPAQGNGTPARSLRAQESLQDIQEIVDKLAAVTQQLRHPKRSVAGRSN
jgi:hypothetical protein